jgi:hypothetical protein
VSWSYGGLPDSTTTQGRRDAVRLLVKDTVQATARFQDEEVDFFLLENGGNVWYAAADGCEQLASGGASSKSIGDLSISDTATSWLDLATRYRLRGASGAMPYAGGLRTSEKEAYEADTDRVEPFVTRATGDSA